MTNTTDTLTPFSGKTGMTHLTADRALIARDNTALCGRSVHATGIYNAAATPSLIDTHKRLNKTHQTNTCRGCFGKVN